MSFGVGELCGSAAALEHTVESNKRGVVHAQCVKILTHRRRSWRVIVPAVLNMGMTLWLIENVVSMFGIKWPRHRLAVSRLAKAPIQGASCSGPVKAPAYRIGNISVLYSFISSAREKTGEGKSTRSCCVEKPRTAIKLPPLIANCLLVDLSHLALFLLLCLVWQIDHWLLLLLLLRQVLSTIYYYLYWGRR